MNNTTTASNTTTTTMMATPMPTPVPLRMLGRGGSHIGQGGLYASSRELAPLDAVFDDQQLPYHTTLARGGNGEASSDADGGRGGGVLQVNAARSISLAGPNAALRADGETAQGGAGGGAGGTVLLSATSLLGQGVVSANGGAGSGAGGGGGGGGLVYSEIADQRAATVSFFAFGGHVKSKKKKSHSF